MMIFSHGWDLILVCVSFERRSVAVYTVSNPPAPMNEFSELNWSWPGCMVAVLGSTLKAQWVAFFKIREMGIVGMG